MSKGFFFFFNLIFKYMICDHIVNTSKSFFFFFFWLFVSIQTILISYINEYLSIIPSLILGLIFFFFF